MCVLGSLVGFCLPTFTFLQASITAFSTSQKKAHTSLLESLSDGLEGKKKKNQRSPLIVPEVSQVPLSLSPDQKGENAILDFPVTHLGPICTEDRGTQPLSAYEKYELL